jgi:hypothetical protein
VYAAADRDLLSLTAKNSYFANSDLDKSHMRTLRIYLYLTGVHLMGVHFMEIHFMGMYLIGVHLTGMCLMGVYLIGIIS